MHDGSNEKVVGVEHEKSNNTARELDTGISSLARKTEQSSVFAKLTSFDIMT